MLLSVNLHFFCILTIKTYIETGTRNNVKVYNALLKLILEKPYTLKQLLEHDADK